MAALKIVIISWTEYLIILINGAGYTPNKNTKKVIGSTVINSLFDISFK